MRWGVDLRPEPQYPPPTPIPTLIGIGIGYSVGPYRNRPIATWPSAIMLHSSRSGVAFQHLVCCICPEVSLH